MATATKNVYYDDSYISSETVTLAAGGTYTPSAHLPSHSSSYVLDSIYVYDPSTGSYRDYTTGAFTVTSNNYEIDYFFVQQAQEETFYARLYYNANGGSGAPSSVNKSQRDYDYASIPFTVVSTVPYWSGRKFLGWSTSSTAVSASYVAGNTFYIDAYSTSSSSPTTATLYAVWARYGYDVTAARNQITIDIAHITGFNYYRVDIRPNGSSATQTQYVTQSGGTISVTFDGLTEETEYIIRVRYSDTSSDYSKYTLWYTASSETADVWTTAGIQPYIWHNGSWHAAQAYVWSNGAWRIAQPNIWSGGEWN